MMKNFPHFSKLRVESLEERTLLAVMAGGPETAIRTVAATESAVWVVNTLEDSLDWATDDEVVSLREAIERANDGDKVTFGDLLTGGTIVLTGNEIVIDKGITIDASAIGGITIDGNRKSRVFSISGSTSSPTTELINLVITGGEVSNNNGGGIYSFGSTLQLTSCTISNCFADGDSYDLGSGGGIYSDSSTLTMVNCSVSGNFSRNEGGGIFSNDILSITNCVIVGNSARSGTGGGIYNGSNLTMINCTVSGNYVINSGGGGISGGSNLIMINSIVAFNQANYDNNIYGNTFTGTNNIIGIDPGFVVAPVFKNGKLTNLDDLNFSLTAESYAIDHGTNDVVDTETDILGTPRIFAAWKEVATVDIGAYEYQYQAERGKIEEQSVVVTTALDVLDDTDGLVSLREAIHYAKPGETIIFDSFLAGQEIILSGVELTIDKSLSIDATSVGGIVISANNKSRVFNVDGHSGDVTVDFISLTIKKGLSHDGGGIYNNANLSLKNCIFSSNFASSGGGILNEGSLTIEGSSFLENSANWGGGIYNRSLLTMSTTTILRNRATKTLVNAARTSGAGIANYGTLTMFDCTVKDNHAQGVNTNAWGGGIWNNYGTLTMTNCIITGNSVNGYFENCCGGGIANDRNGTLRLINCSVYGNSARKYGGGIYNYDAAISITITNCTIAGNHAYGSGGGIFGELILSNSIVACNDAVYDSDISTTGKSVINANNIIGVAPGFVTAPIFENGELTNLEQVDLSLTPTSIAIDQGDNRFVDAETDIVGSPRIFASWKPEATVDIGAYEYQIQVEKDDADSERPSTVVTTTLDVFDPTDGLISLREAVFYASPGDTITFETSLSGQEFKLVYGELILDKTLIIDATSLGGITILGNTKNRVFYICGGLENLSVELIAITVRDGCAYNGGGILNAAILTLTNCNISKNFASNTGGGISNTGSLTLKNCIITGNSSDYNGGGIYSSGCLTLKNCTVSGNATNQNAGGIYIQNTGSSDNNVLAMFNTIVALNYAKSYSDIYKDSYSVQIDYSCNIVGFDPGFVVAPIFQLGKLTNYDTLDLSLTSNSWAIDRGDNDAVESTLDFSGNPRIVSSRQSESIVDIGAYEFQDKVDITPDWVVTTTNDIVDSTDGVTSLREAILNAASGETIVFDVTLTGQTIILSSAEITINKSIAIDASSIDGITVDAAGRSRVFSISGTSYGVTVELTGLTITGGVGNYGGGVNNNNDGILKLTDCAIVDNKATNYGGGIYNLGKLIMLNCKITNNSSSQGGGVYNSGILRSLDTSFLENSNDGIYNYGTLLLNGCTVSDNTSRGINNSGTLTLTCSTITKNSNGGVNNNGTLTMSNCLISENTASYGGGVYNSGNLTIADCTFNDNSANSYGGGIYFSYSSRDQSITDCIIIGNTASCGGGIYASGSKITMSDCEISKNTSISDYGYGGGIYSNSDQLTLISCSVIENYAGGNRSKGGGIYNNGSIELIGCVVCANICDDTGGGLYNSYSLILSNCTVSANSAAFGGGVWNDDSKLYLSNSILSLNNAGRYNDVYYRGVTLLNNHNIIGLDPGFVIPPLFVSGVLTNLDELDFSLAANSCAIDRGDNGVILTEKDFADNQRVFAAWKPDATVDIGAYEYQQHIEGVVIETPSTIVTTVDDLLDETDGLISLREAILYASAGGQITFDAALAECAIILRGLEIVIDKDLTIDASDIGGVTIDANSGSRVFNINSGSDEIFVELTALRIINGRAYDGGGIYNTGNTKLIDCFVSGCTSENKGGGFYNSGTLILTNSSISDNNSSNQGGGFYNNGTTTLTNCSITNNTSKYGAGFYNSETIVAINSVFLANYASEIGGGLYNDNSAGVSTLTNCTITGNSANNGGSGVCNYANLTITNTIVALNNNSDIEGRYTGNNNVIGFDPGFLVPPIFDTGRLINFDLLDVSLTSTSWAVDRGENSAVLTEIDLDGNPRIVASWKLEPTVDIGAIEFQYHCERYGECPSSVVTTHLDIINDTDNLISLREAILYATNGDTITFDDHLSDQTIALSGSPLIIDKVLSVNASSINGITIDGNNNSRIFSVINGSDNGTIELNHLTITGGNESNGAGIYNIGNLSLLNCTITANKARSVGGGIANSGNLTMADCLVFENVASDGGAIYNGGTLILTDTIISCNTADNAGGGINNSYGIASVSGCSLLENSAGFYGGGISNYGDISINNCILKGNVGVYEGGGISNWYGSSKIVNSIIEENSALTSGGVECGGGTVELVNCSINGNNASQGLGGGINIWGYYGDSTVVLLNCAISGNYAYYQGGGVSLSGGGVLTLSNCSIFGNTTDGIGGGIYNSGAVDMSNCTVTANTANSVAGGITNYATLEMSNSIVSLNYAQSDDNIYNPGDVTTSNIVGTDPGFKNPPVYDELGNLINLVELDLSLESDSSAINAGDNSYVVTEFDLAGNPRIVNGIVDIGAYEYQGDELEQLPAPTIATGNKGIYVSYGANRHQIAWDKIDNASGYELAYSADGSSWTTSAAEETSAVITGLAYGAVMQYRVRAVGDGVSYIDSDWSDTKSFVVCPVDINNDGDISGGDRTLLAQAWLTEEGEEGYRDYSDINGDGDVGGADRVFLSNNWLLSVEDDADDLVYPPAKVSDAVFAGFASADLAADLNVF